MKILQFDHIRSALHRYIFSMKAIRQSVEQTCEGRALNVFASQNQPAVEEARNGLNPAMPAFFFPLRPSF
ncbi:hypothetical protein [Mucilaginibacter ginsenosidivorans]|uniref:Uncharacterized protein n=1 Tax=Mucilaginibacter ginsenosidivorans TaxID=398053 RepID=A0A5B8UTW3_9SPHI|nr:hypothetical protein [Mucilaginibacter ginsenosidivorans]QEC62474.1 hypothetical protein FRZ54_07700 [Mucilaginibacter ginsenosidivorans]